MLCLASVVFLLAFQQTPQPRKASINGVVVRNGTNDPIRNVRITATRIRRPEANNETGSSTLQTTSDDKGYFAMPDVEPGTYTLVAQRNGFTRQAYGERATGRPGQPINIVAGQAVTDIVFRLVPSGAVAGRVWDSTGEALPNINVQLLRSTYGEDGSRRLQRIASATTNDRGEYRMYWITPGRYYVSAASRRAFLDMESNQVNTTTNEVNTGNFALTYYPGTTNPTDASAIEVMPGVELTTLDFTLTAQQLFRVRGRIFEATTGQIPTRVTVFLLYRTSINGSAVASIYGNSYNSLTGTFELNDIVPGSYWIQVQTMPDATNPKKSARVPIEVSASDLDNVTIGLNSGFTIAGKIAVEGGNIASIVKEPKSVVVSLIPTDGLDGPQSAQSISADGAFSIGNLSPGQYHIGIEGLPAGFYLKTAHAGQIDILGGIQLSGPLPDRMELLLSPKSAQIAGTVRDSNGRIATGAQVVLVPDRQRDRTDLYRVTRTDQNGQFAIRSIRPGTYRVFTWDDIEPFAYYDRDVLRKYEQSGTLVTLDEMASLMVELKAIAGNQ